MAPRTSPNPVWQLLDLNGEVIATINNDGGSTIPAVPSLPNTNVNGTSAFMQVARVTIPSAMLLTLHATPVQILPAPGANKIIQVMSTVFRIIFGTVAYTLNAGTLKIFYGIVANAKAVTADQAALLTATANGTAVNTTGVALVGTASAPLTDAQALNVGLYLGNDGSAEYTLGDGNLEIIINYMQRAV